MHKLTFEITVSANRLQELVKQLRLIANRIDEGYDHGSASTAGRQTGYKWAVERKEEPADE